jgi:hypothetical protein
MNKIKTFQGKQHQDVADVVNTWLEANPNIMAVNFHMCTAICDNIAASPYITIMITYQI